jgi:hypothetical protein
MMSSNIVLLVSIISMAARFAEKNAHQPTGEQRLNLPR